MPLLLIAGLGAVLLLPLVLLPLSVIQRYRVGTARRPARAWLATVNLVTFTCAATFAIAGAALAGLWIPRALLFSSAALAAGVLLGMLGVATSVWEHKDRTIYFTPNRWLVLLITGLVVTRLAYGVWRGWQAWVTYGAGGGWLAASGAAGSLAAGALVVGYGAGFWGGVRWRIARRRAASLMSV